MALKQPETCPQVLLPKAPPERGVASPLLKAPLLALLGPDGAGCAFGRPEVFCCPDCSL